MRLVCAAFAAGVLIAPAAATAATGQGSVVADERAAVRVFLAYPKVERWLQRYPSDGVGTSASFRRDRGWWEVVSFAGAAGQVAGGRVDTNGRVLQAWVGPEVAWPLARGDGLGGVINRPLVWLSFCAFFVVGLANFRRLLSVRNLDVLGILSFSAYLVLFNDGRVFAATCAATISFVYLLGRCIWIGITNRASPAPSPLPTWLLVAGLVFLLGMRIGLNIEKSGVLDVGYAGVIGADRLLHAQTPYGNFPVNGTGKPCGPRNEDGAISDWIQQNGRCETANHLGDTYGPVNYHAYIPGLWLFGWSGKWDFLPAVHFTTILFDLLAMLGLAAVGYRYGRMPLALTLAFAWAANPFTQYPSSSNTNDAIMPALLIWGFWAASSSTGRGISCALASWTKFAALIVAPLWMTYPRVRDHRRSLTFAAAFVVTTVLSFWAVLLDGDPIDAISLFFERTFEIQAERNSPFSPWDWGDYHAAGIPDLSWLQRPLQLLLVVSALAVAVIPRHKSPRQLAALTAALLIGFELVLTHWAALYIVWFFPFAAIAMFAGRALEQPEPAPIHAQTSHTT